MQAVRKAALLLPMMVALSSVPVFGQYHDHGRFYSGVRQGGHGGYYGDRHHHGDYYDHRHDNGIGPGKGALIGAGGGAVLGAVFGGGLKGTIIGGAAGAGIGAALGAANQNNHDHYRRY